MTAGPVEPFTLHSWIHVTPAIVSRSFREAVAQALPSLDSREGYWELLGYLMFGTFRDAHSGRLVLPQRLLARFEKKEDKRRYAAEPFLQAFKSEVLPAFAWTAHDYRKGLAREVLDEGLPVHIEQLLTVELQNLNTNLVAPPERVFFESGQKPTDHIRRQLLADTQELAEARTSGVHNTATRLLLGYLNSLPSNGFTKVVRRNMTKARLVASRLEKYDKGKVSLAKTEASRVANLTLLRKIAEQPKPFYQPSSAGNTVRVFSLNESILGLSREVRRALTDGWFEYDLRSSQLAIVAKLWDIQEVQSRLRATTTSIWDEILDELGVRNPQERREAKNVLKTGLYSLVFGMYLPRVKAEVTLRMKDIGLDLIGQTVLEHPILQAVAKARERVYQSVKASGGLTTVFGDSLCVQSSPGKRDGLNIYSLLAQEAQAMELALMLPAFKFALRHRKSLTITLFQHDGFCVNYKATGKNLTSLERGLLRCVSVRANDLGIETELVRS